MYNGCYKNIATYLFPHEQDKLTVSIKTPLDGEDFNYKTYWSKIALLKATHFFSQQYHCQKNVVRVVHLLVGRFRRKSREKRSLFCRLTYLTEHGFVIGIVIVTVDTHYPSPNSAQIGCWVFRGVGE